MRRKTDCSFVLRLATCALLLLLTPRSLLSQERGAAALAEAVEGLGVTMRVLMVAAHPDDEDTNLIAWLSRGRHVETAYLSLTRGDGGQNLIGDELGEALGVIRTEELLAARRIDGGRQYFTRAYDFGFSKSAEETYAHWPKDTILGDVVRVVRQFRPHVIVAVFTGTERDGHGHHQVSGQLAREAYRVATDTLRFPRETHGVPWEPLKLYGGTYFDRNAATLRINAGEYDPVLGRSYAEIAAESRSEHRSQGFGQLQRKGPVWRGVVREDSRVPAPADARAERSLFDGIDTTLARLRPGLCRDASSARLGSLTAALASVQRAFDWRDPEAVIPAAHDVRMRARGLTSSEPCVTGAPPAAARQAVLDLERSARIIQDRAREVLQLATGLAVEVTAPREVVAAGAQLPYRVAVYNRGDDTLAVWRNVSGAYADGSGWWSGYDHSTLALPDSAVVLDRAYAAPPRDAPASPSQPYWLSRPRQEDFFAVRPRGDETQLPVLAFEQRLLLSYGQPPRPSPQGDTGVYYVLDELQVPLEYRFADPVRGDVSRPVAVVPAISVTLDRPLELLPANTDVARTLRVRLRSADTAQRTVTVRVTLPPGLTADSASRTVTLAGYEAQATVSFGVRGRMAPGRDTIRVAAESEGETFDVGYQLVDYPHIRPRRMYRPAVAAVQAVDVRVPAGLRVAYVPGVSDVVAPALQELGVNVTVIAPAELASADLSRFTTVVVGPRAYDAHPEVMANRAKLLDFARRGGTLVVQYQQYALHDEGVAPYPMTIARPHDRVTIEEAPVTVLDAASPLLTGPNAIGAADFDGWVQERSLYMPREFDARYAAPLEMHDPGEPERSGALLVAPLGEGTYVYTAISFFRQLPAGVPGAARLFVNLLAAGRPTVTP